MTSSVFVLAVFFLANDLPESSRPLAMGEPSLLVRHVRAIEREARNDVNQVMGDTENAILKAR